MLPPQIKMGPSGHILVKDLVHSEIMTPDSAPEWMKDRIKLWNAVEDGEKQKDAPVFHEIEIALPNELNHQQRIDLVREFTEKNFVSKGMIADLSLHRGEENPRAHIMFSMQAIDGDGFGPKARQWNQKALVSQWRDNWAEIQNAHLAKAGHDITVDHRSNLDRGIDNKQTLKLGSSDYSRDADLSKIEEYQRIMQENGEKIIADPYVALKEISYQKALFKDADIYKYVHSHSGDAEQYQKACDSIFKCDELIRLGIDVDGKRTYTTKELVEAEEKMLQTTEDLSKEKNHPVEEQYIKQAINTRTMNEDQEKAFHHIVSGGDVSTVIGYAGTGKSYTLGAVREAYESQGLKITGMALSGIAAEGLEHGSGIMSSTIHRKLRSWDNGYELPDEKTVVVVDEAGMVGTRQMHRITEYVKDAGAKLVLVGDNDQLQPIEAGGSFRGIVERTGAATLGEIMRQKTEWQKEATKMMSGTQAQVADAIDRYDEHGHIKLSDNLSDAKTDLINDWSTKVDETGETVILAFRNKDVRDLNERARQVFADQGRLAGQETEITTEKGKRNFSVGDRVIFLKNEYSIGVKNGSLGSLEEISDKSIAVKLDSGKTVSVDTQIYKNIDHGYAATIHKSQGVTVKNTYVLVTRHLDKHATYVAMSRHKDDVRVYASINKGLRNSESFMDYAHMKLGLSRDRKKDLVQDYGHQRGVEVDLSKIYRKDIFEATVTSEKLRKNFNRTMVIDGSLNKEQKIASLRKKAQGFAEKVQEITGVDKSEMTMKVERVEEERYIELTEKWKGEDQRKQHALTENKFLSKDQMAQVNWPPFPREEQSRLLTKFNAGEFEMIRFSKKDESVQGQFIGAFDHQGVSVGAIQSGREGDAKLTLVPFTDKLAPFVNRDVRYDIGKDQVSDRLQKQIRMVITEQGTGKSFLSKAVTIETDGRKSIDEQKKDLSDNMQKQLKLSSKKFDIKFEEMDQEKVRTMEIERSVSNSQELKL